MAVAPTPLAPSSPLAPAMLLTSSGPSGQLSRSSGGRLPLGPLSFPQGPAQATRPAVITLWRRAPWPHGCALAALGAWLGATGCSRLTLPSGDELASLNHAYDEPRG